MSVARLKIVGKASERHAMTGQDMKVIAVVNGVEHLLPATAVSISCDGRKSFVEATVHLVVDELVVDGISEFAVVAAGPDSEILSEAEK